jgi:hypothetical protein
VTRQGAAITPQPVKPEAASVSNATAAIFLADALHRIELNGGMNFHRVPLDDRTSLYPPSAPGQVCGTPLFAFSRQQNGT